MPDEETKLILWTWLALRTGIYLDSLHLLVALPDRGVVYKVPESQLQGVEAIVHQPVDPSYRVRSKRAFVKSRSFINDTVLNTSQTLLPSRSQTIVGALSLSILRTPVRTSTSIS
jgi:hypothetical protein